MTTHEPTTRWRRRWSTALVLAGVVIMAAVGIGVARSQTVDASSPTGSWPVRITYALDQFDGSEWVHSEYVLESLGWTSWRQVTICCDPDTGFIVEFRPDSSLWSGGLPGLPLAEGFIHEENNGMVPIADLAPRFPPTAEQLANIPLVQVLFDLEAGIAAESLRSEVLAEADRLQVDGTDLLVYRVDRPIEADGQRQDAIDIRWIYKPLNLTLRNEVIVSGTSQRLFQVRSIEFLSSDFSIPFGEPAGGS